MGVGDTVSRLGLDEPRFVVVLDVVVSKCRRRRLLEKGPAVTVAPAAITCSRPWRLLLPFG